MSHLRETHSRATVPSHREEKLEVVWASGQDASWIPPGREVFWACPTERRPQVRPKTRWKDYISRLVWEHLGVLSEELEEAAGEREVWASLLQLLPRDPGNGEINLCPEMP